MKCNRLPLVIVLLPLLVAPLVAHAQDRFRDSVGVRSGGALEVDLSTGSILVETPCRAPGASKVGLCAAHPAASTRCRFPTNRRGNTGCGSGRDEGAGDRGQGEGVTG